MVAQRTQAKGNRLRARRVLLPPRDGPTLPVQVRAKKKGPRDHGGQSLSLLPLKRGSKLQWWSPIELNKRRKFGSDQVLLCSRQFWRTFRRCFVVRTNSAPIRDRRARDRAAWRGVLGIHGGAISETLIGRKESNGKPGYHAGQMGTLGVAMARPAFARLRRHDGTLSAPAIVLLLDELRDTVRDTRNQPPNAKAGLMATPSTVTWRSERGKP